MHDLDLYLRILLASGLGFAIGWERRIRGQVVGDRTFALVCSGSAAFTVLGVDAFPATAEKLIAGIVTGIGFIGAGIILHTSQGELKGLTTAASIWATAAVGVLAGGDRAWLALGFTLMILLILEIRHIPGLSWLDAERWEQRFANDEEPGWKAGTSD